MVTTDFSQKLARHLEVYLWHLAQFQLPVSGYDLILLMPTTPDSWSEKRTLLLSASALSKQPKWDATYGILQGLQAGLDSGDYLSIFNVDIIEPTAFVVKQVKKYLRGHTDDEVEAPISLIGGVTNQTITVVNNNILASLALGQSYKVTRQHKPSFTGTLSAVHPQENASEVSLVFDTAQGLIPCSFTHIATLAAA